MLAVASGTFAQPGSFIEAWLNFAAYPALLTLYAGGIVALDRLLRRRAEDGPNLGSEVLSRLLGAQVTARWQHTTVSVLTFLNNEAVFYKLADFLPNARPSQKWYYPGSNLLRSGVGQFVAAYLSGDQYEVRFDQFEYLLGLVHLHAHRLWGALGEFAYFQLNRPALASAIGDVRSALAGPAGESFVRAGIFETSGEVGTAIEAYDQVVRERANRGYL